MAHPYKISLNSKTDTLGHNPITETGLILLVYHFKVIKQTCHFYYDIQAQLLETQHVVSATHMFSSAMLWLSHL